MSARCATGGDARVRIVGPSMPTGLNKVKWIYNKLKLVGRRMTSPLLTLTNVARCTATGDLSARADIRRADEIGSLGRAFNEMANRVEGTVGTLRHVASDAAHELHTPLTALHTNLELASTSPAPAKYLQRVYEQLQRVEDLTIDLLDLSRIETDNAGDCEQGCLLARSTARDQ